MGVASISLAVLLSGCSALPNNSDTGLMTSISQSSPIKSELNEKRIKGILAAEKTVWKSGDLEGFCSSQPTTNAQTLIVDDVLLSTDALFETAIASLSVSGEKVLQQLVHRLSLYTDIKRIELIGHADERGSAAKNYTLAENRAESVRRWLTNELPEPIDMRVLSLGESQSGKEYSVQDLANDRRVDVRIIAASLTSSGIDSTLCSSPSVGDQIASNSALRVSTNAPEKSLELNRLDPYDGDLPISPGDQLTVKIAGDEDWDGVYEVSVGGGIDIPLLGRLSVRGLTIPAIKTLLADELVDKQLVRASAVNVDANVIEWSPVEVYVRGSVFQKGRVSINFPNPDYVLLRPERDGGDDGRGRLLSFALQKAGGVRPDADLSNIQILRNGATIPVDLSGLVHGELARDIPLIDGDEVVVGTTGGFDDELVKPTQITPPGIRVFLSNATAPVFGNAVANLTKDESAMPYGSRVVHALTTMNCIGGAQSVNAARRAVHISTDHLSNQLTITERPIQKILNEANTLDNNPFMMPGDALACYDSDVSNVREVAKVFNDLLSPLVALSVIFGQF